MKLNFLDIISIPWQEMNGGGVGRQFESSPYTPELQPQLVNVIILIWHPQKNKSNFSNQFIDLSRMRKFQNQSLIVTVYLHNVVSMVRSEAIECPLTFYWLVKMRFFLTICTNVGAENDRLCVKPGYQMEKEETNYQISEYLRLVELWIYLFKNISHDLR